MYPTSIRCINSCRAEWEKSNSLWVTCLGTDCPRVSIYCQLLLPCLNQVATALFESSRLCHLIQRALPCSNQVSTTTMFRLLLSSYALSVHFEAVSSCWICVVGLTPWLKETRWACRDYRIPFILSSAGSVLPHIHLASDPLAHSLSLVAPSPPWNGRLLELCAACSGWGWVHHCWCIQATIVRRPKIESP